MAIGGRVPEAIGNLLNLINEGHNGGCSEQSRTIPERAGGLKYTHAHARGTRESQKEFLILSLGIMVRMRRSDRAGRLNPARM